MGYWPHGRFFIKFFFGCLLTSYLKNYLSEEEAEKSLKCSSIKKSELTYQGKSSLKKFKKIMRIYKFTLNPRGGFDVIKAKLESDTYEVTTEIRNIVERTFDAFLIASRSQIQTTTTTRYIKLQDFPSGKMLKVNRRNNSLHYYRCGI